MSPHTFRTAGGAVAALAMLLAASCTDPTASEPPPSPAASRGAGHWRAPASVEWNAIARELVAANRSSVFAAFRNYATTSVAQYEAVLAAERASSWRRRASRRAAVAAASAVALVYAYPADSAALEARLRQQLASPDWIERGGVDVAAGEAIGRAVGARVVARAKTDRFFDPWTGTVPTGPGRWFSSAVPPAPPVGAAIGQARTFFLRSGDQFRPPPPPAFGSPAFLAALAEVRQIADTRTAEQDSIARYWAFPGGTYTPPGYWNEQAATLALRYRLDERRAAHLLALLDMVAMDAIIASHDAKYAYWLLRPSQADPAITLSMPLPNFPSYPSNHATISAAMAEVLADAFPSQARRLRAQADQAALSRVYGGIHYRFDGEVGLALGRKIARYALRQDGHGR